MKSVKPGRGPSMQGGIIGLFMIGFGILWTILAASASPIFALFGVLWTGIAVVNTIYNFKNAKSKNRYSAFDIVDSHEEPDPLNRRYGGELEAPGSSGTTSRFCPWCGRQTEREYEFCPGCGKKLPD